MTEIQIILSKIAEEAGEVAQAAMKAQKYGLKNNRITGSVSKAQLLAEESFDLLFAIGKLYGHSEEFSKVMDMLMANDKEEELREEKWKKMLEKCKVYEEG